MPADRRRFGIAACILLWLALTVRLASHLPVQPQWMGDTQDYLTLAAQRPPVYGWILAAYRWAAGGLQFLPLFQFLLLSAGLLLFSVQLGLLLDSALVGAASLVLCLLHPTIHDCARVIETEPVFAAFVLAGLGLLFRAVRSGEGAGKQASLIGAAVLFALAAATRTTGAAFLMLPPFVAVFDRSAPWRAGLKRAGPAVGGALLVLLVAMAGNWVKNDRFEIGSFGGVSLLGKALILIQPSDLPALPEAATEAARATLAPAAHARAIVADAPDLAASMRAQMQTSQDLRFAIFFPAAAKTWPAFASKSWRDRSALVLGVARPLIRNHPIGYGWIWLRDWEELLLYPSYWPAWATSQPAPPGDFPACRTMGDCYSLDRYDLPMPSLISILFLSVAGAVAGLLLILTRTLAVLRRRAGPQTTLFLGLAIVLHASLVLSAAAEAGFVRYTVALHPLDVALVLWLALAGLKRLARGTGSPRRRVSF